MEEEHTPLIEAGRHNIGIFNSLSLYLRSSSERMPWTHHPLAKAVTFDLISAFTIKSSKVDTLPVIIPEATCQCLFTTATHFQLI